MNALSALAPYARKWSAVGPVEARCHLCATAIAEESHSHVVDVERRSLLCACRACADLVHRGGRTPPAGGVHYQLVPTRVVTDPSFVLDQAQWDALEIPVRLAFVFFHSQQRRWVALYPSPAGAAESALSLDAFQALAAAAPLVAAVQPDVEALLVRGQPDGTFQSFLVSIETCYRLVGQVRVHWQGFNGGDRAWSEIAAFFADLRARATLLEREPA